jgi:4-amino-4-deoxy-L-arabinose transferase
MDDLPFGIITIIICSIGYFYSWRSHRKDNYTTAILLLLVCGLIIRIYTACDFYLHEWDERYHGVVAKNLIQNPWVPTLYDNPVLPYNYKNWASNHIWLHKQPLSLWSMALSMRIFGVNEIALRIPSILLSTIGIWLTFTIGSYFFNRKVGYIAAFLHSINGLIIELTAGRVATDHIDIFFLFFIELAVFFSIAFFRSKKMHYNLLAGISIGAAILSKWLPALVVLPVWIFIVLDDKYFSLRSIGIHIILLITSALIVFLPWQIYIHHAFPLEASWEASQRFKHLTEVIEGQSGPVYYFLTMIRINYGELIYIPLLWFSWKIIQKHELNKRLALLCWFAIPLIFFSIAKTKMQAYMLITCPALFIISAEFWYFLRDYRNNQKLRWLFTVVLILLIVLPIRYTIERVKPFDRIDRNPEWVAELKKLNDQDINNGVLLNYNRPIEAMFYTNLIAYSHIPAEKEIVELISRGFTVIVNDDGKVPSNIKMIDGIEVNNFTDANLTIP